MQLTVSRYRLTTLGKIGAFLFIAPTPIAAYHVQPPELTSFEQRLKAAGSTAYNFEPSMVWLVTLATASLIGLVLLFVGREIITTEA